MPTKLLHTVAAAALLLSFAACSADVEGCTDPIARNFNAEADADCCCEYYQVQLQCRHFARDTAEALQLGGAFFDPQGNALRADALQLLLSDIQLIDYDGIAFPIEDSLLFDLRDGAQLRLPNDARALTPESVRLKMGKFSRTGDYAALRLHVGLSTSAANIDATALPSATHPLASTASPVFWDSTQQRYNSYLFAFYDAQRDTTYTLTDSSRISVDIPVEISVRDGADITVNIDISYMQMLYNVDLLLDSPATLRSKIADNLRQRVFSLR